MTSDPSPGSGALARREFAVAALGLRALTASDDDMLVEEALAVVTEALDVPMCGLLEATSEPDRYRFRAGRGWSEGVVGAVVAAEPGSALRFMLDAHEPVIYDDLSREKRFVPPPLLLEHGVVAGIGVPLHGRERPLGVLGAHATRARRFEREDANFLQAVANVLSSAMERSRSDAELRRREERFRALASNAQDILYRFRLSPELGFEYINPAVERVLGYSPQEYYDDPGLLARVVAEEDRDVWSGIGSDFSFDEPLSLRCVRRDGAIVWLEIRHVPIHDESGRTVALEGIARDVTASMAARDELRRAYELERATADQLRALDEMKNSFLHAVSHELRTPLTNILGIALTLRHSIDQLSQDERVEVIGRLTANAQKLDRLLGDLLDVDRLRRGTIEPRRSPTPLLALVRRVAEEIDLGTRSVTVEGDETEALVDAAKVERIVENLLTNAARHTPPDSKVWLRVEPSGPDGALLFVEDDGPGVPEPLRATVFEPFRQGPIVDAAAPGTGIGLSLVQLFAELHGGRAWVEDRPGGGARFGVHLPGGAADVPGAEGRGR